MNDSAKEREILLVMRKVLSTVIREITPPAGARHPLSEKTIVDVRMCLGLISSRERELAEAAGISPERPHYSDEPPASKVVSITKISKLHRDGEVDDS